jgi:hypothetical protein
MNIPDHISESLETIFWVMNIVLKFFDTDPDPGSGIFLTLDPGSGMEQFGSATLARVIDMQTLTVSTDMQ